MAHNKKILNVNRLRTIRLLFLIIIILLLPIVKAKIGEEEELNVGSNSTSGEEIQDDRTKLDLFGERAKEFFTTRVIPDTDEECRWDWRHARCNPYCQCELSFQWGDYHLGRACRLRPTTTTTTTDSSCDVPPDTVYAKFMDTGIELRHVIKAQIGRRTGMVAEHVKEGFELVRMQACREIPILSDDDNDPISATTNCFDYKRSIPERLFCGHIPSCEDEFDDDDIDISVWMKQQEEKRSMLID